VGYRTHQEWFASAEYRSLRRLTLRACGLRLVVAYPVVYLRMRQGTVPAHTTWLGAAIVPLVPFWLLISFLVVPSWFPRKPRLATRISVSVCLGLAFLLL
jgi:hypothetical protein